MSEPIISVSGLRGLIGSQLTPATVVRYISAYCTTLTPGPIVISRDGRHSGPMLKYAIISTLIGHGKTVLDAEIAATPTVGVLVKSLRAAGGIQLTASHNPTQYNGLKLFDRNGRVIGPTAGQAVHEAYKNCESAWSDIDSLGSLAMLDDPHHAHLEKVLATVDVRAISARKYRVLLDSNHGSGGILGLRLLQELGCHVEMIGEIPDGNFAHSPEPIQRNLQQIASRVRDGDFDVGFCQDPDADRLAIIDSKGVYIGEEYTAVLCTLNALLKSKKNDASTNKSQQTIVTNCASSSMNQHLADRFGAKLVRSKVGEANVIDAMIQHNAIYGGEGSGGPIDPSVGGVRDSFVGMAAVLELITFQNCSIAELVATLPKLHMIKDKLELADVDINTAMQKIEQKMSADFVSTLDGLRLDWPDAWLLIRGSNTEPILRLICEATSDQHALELIAKAKAIVGSGR